MPIAYLRPIAVGVNNGWNLDTVPTKQAAVDGGPVPDLSGNYSGGAVGLGSAFGNFGSGARQSFVFGTRPPMAAITAVEAVVAWNLSGGTDSDLYVATYLDGTPLDAGFVHVNSSGAVTTFTLLNPRTGTSVWSLEDVLNQSFNVDLRISWGASSPTTIRSTLVMPKITYVAVPTQNNQARDVASRRMNESRRESPLIHLGGMPIDFLDLEIGDEFSLADPAYPTASGYGLADKETERALMRLVSFESINIEQDTVDIVAQDLRDQLTTFRDSGLASGPSSFADGCLRLDRGNTRVFSRASKAWVEDPDQVVRELPVDTEKLDRRGIVIERASTNGIKNSSMRNGAANSATNWTPSAPTNGSGIVDAAPSALFDPGITSRGIEMHAGNPHTAVFTFTSDASASIVARRLSVDYTGDNAESVNLRLSRASDGWFFDDTLNPPQFAAPVVGSTITGNGQRQRWTSAVIPAAAADTYTIQFRIPSGGTASRKFKIWHVQLETVPWASTRIVTDAASFTRTVELLEISNNVGRRAWDETGYTAFLRYIPFYSSADILTGSWQQVLLRAPHDGSNVMQLWYDGGAGQFYHYRQASGVGYLTAVTQALTAYSDGYVLAIRANGAKGELGLSPYTLSIWCLPIGGSITKGVEVVSAAVAVQNTVNMQIGSDPSLNQCAEGAVALIEFKQFVYTDDEVQREMRKIEAAA